MLITRTLTKSADNFPPGSSITSWCWPPRSTCGRWPPSTLAGWWNWLRLSTESATRRASATRRGSRNWSRSTTDTRSPTPGGSPAPSDAAEGAFLNSLQVGLVEPDVTGDTWLHMVIKALLKTNGYQTVINRLIGMFCIIFKISSVKLVFALFAL